MIYHKDFHEWSNFKRRIHLKGTYKKYQEGQLWWCALGLNIGSEQDGKGENHERPVLIVKAINKKTCLIVPLTSSIKQHVHSVRLGKMRGRESVALLAQIRLVDTKRLLRKIGNIDPCLFLYIRETLRTMF